MDSLHSYLFKEEDTVFHPQARSDVVQSSVQATLTAKLLVAWQVKMDALTPYLRCSCRSDFNFTVRPAGSSTMSNVFFLDLQKSKDAAADSSLQSTGLWWLRDCYSFSETWWSSTLMFDFIDFWVHMLDASFEWFPKTIAEMIAS